MSDRVPKTPLLPVKKKKQIILYDFTYCPVFIDIKQTLH